MARFKIKDFHEIDFVNVDVTNDTFEMPDGTVYRFSDSICHNCWAGGTVLESIDEEKKYICVMCGHELKWREFENDFLQPTGDTLDYLLPADWSDEQVQNWFDDYKERRLEEEKVKDRVLSFGK